MPIVKHSKRLGSPFLRKRRSSSGDDRTSILSYAVTLVFASLFCTYLELAFTGVGLYSFPRRPFPDIFTIDIRFTLLFIPCFTFIMLYSLNVLSGFIRLVFLLLVGIIMMISEVLFEQIGLLQHSMDWNHQYSFIGYILFILFIWAVQRMVNLLLSSGEISE